MALPLGTPHTCEVSKAAPPAGPWGRQACVHLPTALSPAVPWSPARQWSQGPTPPHHETRDTCKARDTPWNPDALGSLPWTAKLWPPRLRTFAALTFDIPGPSPAVIFRALLTVLGPGPGLPTPRAQGSAELGGPAGQQGPRGSYDGDYGMHSQTRRLPDPHGDIPAPSCPSTHVPPPSGPAPCSVRLSLA